MTDTPAKSMADAFDICLATMPENQPLTPRDRKFLQDFFFTGGHTALFAIFNIECREVNLEAHEIVMKEVVLGPAATRDLDGPVARVFRKFPPLDVPFTELFYYHGAYSAMKLVHDEAAENLLPARVLPLLEEFMDWRNRRAAETAREQET